jgi:hypothetical protein
MRPIIPITMAPIFIETLLIFSQKERSGLAERRMFAKTIIDSDAFLDMPLSSQALYFHLAMILDRLPHNRPFAAIFWDY